MSYINDTKHCTFSTLLTTDEGTSTVSRTTSGGDAQKKQQEPPGFLKSHNLISHVFVKATTITRDSTIGRGHRIKGQSHIIVLIKTNYHVLLSTPVPQFILHRQLDYFSCCQRHKTGVLPLPRYEKPTPFPAFPSARWFFAAYVRDVWSRMDVLLATATSTHGSILKVDSTKKVCKKLQGVDANTANWMTNVGNKRGEIVVSVLTSSEAAAALQLMADGLIRRYSLHHQPPLKVLYTDHDCCSKDDHSKYRALFHGWDLCVRQDMWHYMRRLVSVCTSESHNYVVRHVPVSPVSCHLRMGQNRLQPSP